MKTSLEVRRKKGENTAAFIFRFNKRVKQSGILKEVKKRRFWDRPVNRRKRRSAALYRLRKKAEVSRLKKYGLERKAK